jgi:4-amino-4-deoxy-L-arabinose transferase-like glycosyltransferase
LKFRARILDWLLLVAICAFFFLWKLAAFGLIGADEPRYAQVAREMLARHDWVTPTLGGTAWLEKPPLYYWQAMVAYRFFGVSDCAARLPSALDAFLLVIAFYLFFRRFRPGIEIDAALALTTMAGIVGFARAASMDMGLSASFGIAMLAWFAWFETDDRAYLAAFYFLLGLGMLAKGPVAPLLAGVVITLFALFGKSPRALWRTLWIPGVAIFIAVALPWYIAVQLRNPQFFRVFILEHNLARFGTNLYHHPEPFWYYIPVVLLGLSPWFFFAMVSAVGAIRKLRGPESDSLNRFALIWLVVVLLFFSISRSKLPGYILPAIPAGAVLFGNWFRHAIANRANVPIAIVHSVLSAALMFSALMIQIILLQPNELWDRAAVIPLLAAIAIGGFQFVLLLKGGYRMLRIATLIPAILVVAITLRAGASSFDRKLSARYISDSLAQYDSHHLPVAAYLVPRETEFGLAFYCNHVIPLYERGEVPEGEHFLVAAQGYPHGVERVAGRKAVLLKNIPEQKLDLFYVPSVNGPPGRTQIF